MAVFAFDGHHPTLPEEGLFIADNATIVGRVSLGAGATVWFGAVVRGDTEDVRIGARTNIQDNSVLHADPGFPLELGADVTVGHRAIVHGCTVGAGSLIGMGAVVLNGARIGAGSIVGAHALVTEGKEFPDGVLIIGSPARVARTLEPEERERNLRTAAHYVAMGQRYRETLRRL
jgi:carbonic anhydrase/acetyltransferase-like protein (isoleucine patch superfamily)